MRWPPAGQYRAGATDRHGFGRLPWIAIDLRERSGRTGRCQALGCPTACTRWQPLRGLPVSAFVEPCVVQEPDERHGHDTDEHDQEDQVRKCSRSACDARRSLWPPAHAAISSPGPAIRGASPRARCTQRVARYRSACREHRIVPHMPHAARSNGGPLGVRDPAAYEARPECRCFRADSNHPRGPDDAGPAATRWEMHCKQRSSSSLWL